MTEASRNDSAPEHPWSLTRLSENIGAYIERLGAVWVEAEVTQWSDIGGHIYGRIKDPEADTSVEITIWRSARGSIPDTVQPGDRILARVKPSWYGKGGKLSMNVLEMRQAGIGVLLEKLEKLRATLQAEGLFDPARKKPLPFLPNLIGLITGKDSDAEKDVLHNARLRWPDVAFHTEYSAVQGDRAVPELIQALDRMESTPGVDVIIIARGGGDFLHLLPFSDEALIRRVAECSIPVVSAIGHEADRPLLDEVSDLRASTPTDAAKRVVPDVAQERQLIADLRQRLTYRLGGFLEGEWEKLQLFRHRPVLAQPEALIDRPAEDLLRLIQRGVTQTDTLVHRLGQDIERLRASVRALSPQAVLDRGYAIARAPDGTVLTASKDARVGQEVSVLLARGILRATVTATEDSAKNGTSPA